MAYDNGYNCYLLTKGYQVEYASHRECLSPHWGVNTFEKKIMLYNIDKKDRQTIDNILMQADMQYRSTV